MKQAFFLRHPGGDQAAGTTAAATTDNTMLKTTETVWVSDDGGTTNVAFPEPNKEYDFCVTVNNAATVNSGPFYVRFSLDDANGGIQNFDFKQDAGLDANQSVLATVHYGQFGNVDVNYTLSACIFSPSAPDRPINCAGTFGFNPHMNAPADNTNTSSSNTSTTGTTSNSGSSSNSSGSPSSTTTNSTSSSTDKDSEGFGLLDTGSWNKSTTLKYSGGQVMHFQVKNVNVLGTTLTIDSDKGGKKSVIIGPMMSADLRFDCFGSEPMGWTFDVSTNSDAFIVTWKLYSSWLPGDPKNG